jgi:hypothetical protein
MRFGVCFLLDGAIERLGGGGSGLAFGSSRYFCGGGEGVEDDETAFDCNVAFFVGMGGAAFRLICCERADGCDGVGDEDGGGRCRIGWIGRERVDVFDVVRCRLFELSRVPSRADTAGLYGGTISFLAMEFGLP